MATARKLCTDALKLSGAVSGIQVPTAGEIELALEELNALVAGWAVESWWSPSQVQRTVSPSGISNEITIGNGTVPAELTDLPPFRIDKLYVKDGSSIYKTIEKPRINIEPDETPGMPRYFSYQRLTPTDGVVTLGRTPDKVYQYVLIYDTSIPVYALDDEVLLPPAHASALAWNLAVVLGVHFGKVDPSVSSIASARFERLKLAQVKTPALEYDYANYNLNRNNYDIYTDE